MGIYNFQSRFEPYILDGSKRHTIRAHRKWPDRPGDTFYGYKGLRTKRAVKLIQAPVLKVEPIVFERARVWIDGMELDRSEKDVLAWRDGFRLDGTVMTVTDPPLAREVGSFDLMLRFWVDTRKTTEFEGALTHWDWDCRVFPERNQ